MSLLRKPKSKRVGSALGRLCDSLFNVERSRGSDHKNRRLVIDQLEERALLSVAAADIQDKMVNQIISDSLSTTSAHSLAMDDNGDFVVVWTQVDSVLDANGDPVINPATNAPMTDSNIYARYFTNEVQRIVLPAGVLLDNDPNALPKFSITVGGNEVQQLTFSATTPSNILGGNAADLITADFKLSFGGNATADIHFDESAFNSGDPTTDPAMLIQTALRDLGGALSDVEVVGVDPHTYKINFGAASQGLDQEQIQIDNLSFGSGFLPSALTSTVSEPVTISDIPIFTDPSLTALAITSAFAQNYQSYVSPPSTANQIPANNGPVFVRVATPTVSVTSVKTADDPLGQRTFNIEFVGDSGYINQPTSLIAPDAVLGDDGNPLNSEVILATTIKESSDEFRVNPEEPDNPATPLPDKFQQTAPDVAMDADGNFVIVWQSEVPSGENPGSFSDIFARMYQPVGYVDPGDPYLGSEHHADRHEPRRRDRRQRSAGPERAAGRVADRLFLNAELSVQRSRRHLYLPRQHADHESAGQSVGGDGRHRGLRDFLVGQRPADQLLQQRLRAPVYVRRLPCRSHRAADQRRGHRRSRRHLCGDEPRRHVSGPLEPRRQHRDGHVGLQRRRDAPDDRLESGADETPASRPPPST